MVELVGILGFQHQFWRELGQLIDVLIFLALDVQFLDVLGAVLGEWRVHFVLVLLDYDFHILGCPGIDFYDVVQVDAEQGGCSGPPLGFGFG